MTSDVEEIRNLTYRYAFLVDTQQVEEMLEVFTDDAVYDARPVGQGIMEGVGEIRTFFVEQNKTLKQSHHVTSNHLIEVSGDTASGTVYFAVEGRTYDGSEVSAWGYYDDRYVRTKEGWKIAKRTGIPLIDPKLGAIGAEPVSSS